jgi:hypothetical protein
MDVTLLGKAALVSRDIARSLIGLPVGERIPGTAELARRYGAGFGTVQKVLGTLEDSGAIQLASHGSRGTILSAKDPARLWQSASLPAITFLLPLPNFPEHEGLASALTDAMEGLGIPFALSYMQGARQRIRAVTEGRCDLVALSLGAAAAACAGEPALACVLDLPMCEYYRRGSLGVLIPTDTGSDSMTSRGARRVGVDMSSHDHDILTSAEFPSATRIRVHFPQIPQLLESGTIDAAIWSETARGPLGLGRKLRFRPLQATAARQLAAQLSATAIVGRRDAVEVSALLHENIDVARLSRVQREVTDGTRVPSY